MQAEPARKGGIIEGKSGRRRQAAGISGKSDKGLDAISSRRTLISLKPEA